MLLLVSIGSISVIAFQGYRSGKTALRQSIFQQLTSLRAIRARQIESYIELNRAQMETLSENLMVIDAMEDLTGAFNQLGEKEIPKAWDLATDEYYRSSFLPRLDESVEGTPKLDGYRPFRKATRYLQYQYIAANPRPVGAKQELRNAKDGSDYSKIHQQYHPVFRNLVKQFGFYDLFLIDADKNNIVYSVHKETDFATSLDEGPYSESNLAKAVELAIKSERGSVILVDFESYRASYGAPAAFMASPIYDGAELSGVIAIQLPIDQINRLMTSNKDWERDGLGKTGETYLVGEDSLMRSTSRFLEEDPEGYFAELSASGSIAEEQVNQIKALNTSILTQEIDTEAVQEARKGENGTKMSRDYRNVRVLTSFAPLQINGVKWFIVADIDEAEAFKPILRFERQVLVSTSAIMLFVTLASLFVSRRFVSPINRLSEAFEALGQKGVSKDLKLSLQSKDEFGQLTQAFNQTVDQLQHQETLIQQQHHDNEALLHRILPQSIAQRIKDNEENIADTCSNVTVLVANIKGFTALTRDLEPQQALAMLNEIFGAFDEAAEQYGIEKIKTMGSGYMAVCGLSVPRLDHTKRMVDFAIAIQRRVRAFNREHGTDLKLNAGINTGEVVAGIVGRSRFVYDIWGDCVSVAFQIHLRGEPNQIRMTQVAYERLANIYDFYPIEPLESQSQKIPLWSLSLGE